MKDFRLKKIISCITLAAFIVLNAGQGYGEALHLPAPGTRVDVSPSIVAPVLKGMQVDPKAPFKFNFILDTGTSEVPGFGEVSGRLIRYFLASLTIPEKDLWVNLSPYEKDRIIPDELSLTEMGRDLLGQDYILKQITASLIYPENETGKAFWRKVYAAAHEKYGSSDIPVDTFNKVWIVPDKAVVYENGTKVFVTRATLKVMLETDYEAASRQRERAGPRADARDQMNAAPATELAKDIIREVIIPVLEKEVNEGANFAQLRQIYYSLILAKWYKETLKDSIINRAYSDQKKTGGVDLADKGDKQLIYEKYLESLRKGAFDYVKEEYDNNIQEILPRKYFSGGCDFSQQLKLNRIQDHSQVNVSGNAFIVQGDYLRVDHAVLMDRLNKMDPSVEDEILAVLSSENDRDLIDDLVEELMESARQGNVLAKRILENALVNLLSDKFPEIRLDTKDGLRPDIVKIFRSVLQEGKAKVTFRIHEQSGVSALQGLFGSLGLKAEDGVRVGYWNEVDEQKASNAFAGFNVVYAKPFDFEKKTEGLIVDFYDGLSYAIWQNTLGLPYYPFKHSVDYSHSDLSLRMKEQMNAGDRQVFVLGSPTAQNISDFIAVYRDIYDDVPVGKRPLVVVAPRGISTNAVLSELENIGKVVYREASFLEGTRERIPLESMANSNVLVVRTQGELTAFYGLADICFVGTDRNILEPAAQGKPVVYFGGSWLNNGKARDLLAGQQGAVEFSRTALMDLSGKEVLRRSMGKNGMSALTSLTAEIVGMTDIAATGITLMALFERIRSEKDNAQVQVSDTHRLKFQPYIKVRDFSWYSESLEEMGFNREFLSKIVTGRISRKRAPITYVDAGCGMGAALEELSERIGHWVDPIGIDIVDWRTEFDREQQREVLRKVAASEFYGKKLWEYDRRLSGEGFEFLQGDVKDVKLPRPADVITSFFTLQYSDAPLESIVNLFNQLNPGGVLVAHLLIPLTSTDIFDFYSRFVDRMKHEGMLIELKAADFKERGVRNMVFVAARKGHESIRLNVRKSEDEKEFTGSAGRTYKVQVVKYDVFEDKPIADLVDFAQGVDDTSADADLFDDLQDWMSDPVVEQDDRRASAALGDKKSVVQQIQDVFPAAGDELADWSRVAEVIAGIKGRHADGDQVKIFSFSGHRVSNTLRKNIADAGIEIDFSFDRKLKDEEFDEFVMGFVNKEDMFFNYALLFAVLENSVNQHGSSGITFLVWQDNPFFERISVFNNAGPAVDKMTGEKVDLKKLLIRGPEGSFGEEGLQGYGFSSSLQAADFAVIRQEGQGMVTKAYTRDKEINRNVDVLKELRDPYYKNTGFSYDFFIFNTFEVRSALYNVDPLNGIDGLDLHQLPDQVDSLIQASAGDKKDILDVFGGVDLGMESFDLEHHGNRISWDAGEIGFENIRIEGLFPVIRSILPVGDVSALMGSGS